MATMLASGLKSSPLIPQELSHVASGFCTGSSSSLSSFSGSLLANSRSSSLSQQSRLRVSAEAKGFGKVVQKTKKSFGKPEKGSGDAATNVCPCGGGEESKLYPECCARYHGGVVEPDAATLMKARFTAYSLGVVPYVVKTTHPKNPDFEGVQDFAADVKATCERLRFLKLEILESQEVSETEANVSFIVTYSILKGGRGERKYLKEKSVFVKEDGRWLYRDREALSQASEAEWMASTFSNAADPENSRKSFNKGTASKPGVTGYNPAVEARTPRIPLKSRTGGK